MGLVFLHNKKHPTGSAGCFLFLFCHDNYALFSGVEVIVVTPGSDFVERERPGFPGFDFVLWIKLWIIRMRWMWIACWPVRSGTLVSECHLRSFLHGDGRWAESIAGDGNRGCIGSRSGRCCRVCNNLDSCCRSTCADGGRGRGGRGGCGRRSIQGRGRRTSCAQKREGCSQGSTSNQESGLHKKED